ncbi:hypothetical protein [Methanospirillum stamsii]|uniref:hypothetical protein n=2 Tax=Methanospirillum stamsii TaxID=1277351 RepID=UPI0011B25C2E|nr:hypothetical protein [Methanospirillum stamsii]
MTNNNLNIHQSQSSDMLPVYVPVFAFELDTIDFIYDSGATSSFITPSGLKFTHFWMVGALTSCSSSKKGTIIRIADPTGVITLHMKYQSNGMNVDPSDLDPPLFLSITGYGEKNPDQNEKLIRWTIETSRIVTRQERDLWILSAADTLTKRLQETNTAIQTGNGTKSIQSALSHYHVRQEYLKKIAELTKKALEVIKEPGPAVEPAELILSIIKEYSGPKGINTDDIYRYTRKAGLSDEQVKETIHSLVAEDEVYQPSPGYIKLL